MVSRRAGLSATAGHSCFCFPCNLVNCVPMRWVPGWLSWLNTSSSTSWTFSEFWSLRDSLLIAFTLQVQTGGAFLAAAVWGGQWGVHIFIWGPRISDDTMHDWVNGVIWHQLCNTTLLIQLLCNPATLQPVSLGGGTWGPEFSQGACPSPGHPWEPPLLRILLPGPCNQFYRGWYRGGTCLTR